MEFEKMLDEIYSNLDSQKKTKLVLPNIDLNITTTNTYWTNIKHFLKKIKRGPDHFVNVMSLEVAPTNWKTGSKSDGVVIIGKVKKDRIISFIQNYMKRFVVCNICKSTNTLLEKNGRLLQLKCNNCNSQYTV